MRVWETAGKPRVQDPGMEKFPLRPSSGNPEDWVLGWQLKWNL